MRYTQEELRQRAAKIDAANAFMDSKNRALANEPAKQLLAHADALDEIERLQKALLRAGNETDYGHLISAEDFYGVFVRARAALAAIREAK